LSRQSPNGTYWKKRAKALEAALMRCDRYCEHLDHAGDGGKWLHSSALPCPVEAMVKEALNGHGPQDGGSKG
jgi:hypothetical protein